MGTGYSTLYCMPAYGRPASGPRSQRVAYPARRARMQMQMQLSPPREPSERHPSFFGIPWAGHARLSPCVQRPEERARVSRRPRRAVIVTPAGEAHASAVRFSIAFASYRMKLAVHAPGC